MPSAKTQPVSLEILIERFHVPLYRFARILAGSEPLAVRFTGEVFKQWNALNELDQRRLEPRIWLFKALYRSFQRQSSVSLSKEPSSGSTLTAADPSSHLAFNFQLDIILECLLQVDDSYRAPVALHYLQILSYVEIAELMDLPTSSILYRLARGKEQVRDLLRQGSPAYESKIVSLPALTQPWWEEAHPRSQGDHL